MLYFDYTDGTDKNFELLCRELDQVLDDLSGGPEQRQAYIEHNGVEHIHDVFVVYDDELAIGCAGFKEFDEESAELKRVFLREAYRRKGIAKNMLGLVEKAAEKKGYKYMILETGKKFSGTIKFYEKMGFKPMNNFGPYEDMPNSVCMRKKLIH